jgi:hypothetical protein
MDLRRFRSSRATWENNLNKVQQHNLQADLGVHTYWLGMNKYADLVRLESLPVNGSMTDTPFLSSRSRSPNSPK